MQEIKRIGVLSTARIFSLFGLVLGVISVAFSKIASVINPQALEAYGLQIQNLGVSSMILGILMSVVVYFLVGLIGALLYNLFAKWVGGVSVELREKTAKAKKRRR